MSTIERLLKKIELDLEKVIDDGEVEASAVDEVAVYRQTLARLREAGIDVEIATGTDRQPAKKQLVRHSRIS